MTDAYVQQLGRGATQFGTSNDGGESVVLRTYKFYDIWPETISEINLSYDDSNVEQFTVNFKVQYFTVGDSLQSNGGNQGEVLIR